MTKSIKISERDFASQVEDLLRRFQWRFMHIKPAMTGKGAWVSRMNKEGTGWLDYLALRPPRIIVVELKDAYSKMTPEQEEWWDMWEGCQRVVMNQPLTMKDNMAALDMTTTGKMSLIIIPELYLWRPKDIEPDGGKILEVLR